MKCNRLAHQEQLQLTFLWTKKRGNFSRDACLKDRTDSVCGSNNGEIAARNSQNLDSRKLSYAIKIHFTRCYLDVSRNKQLGLRYPDWTVLLTDGLNAEYFDCLLSELFSMMRGLKRKGWLFLYVVTLKAGIFCLMRKIK